MHGVKKIMDALLAPTFFALLGIGGLIGIWQLVIIIWKLPAYLLPNPATVGSVIISDWQRLLIGAYVTGYEILISFALSLGLGIAGAAALHFWPSVARLAWPVVVFA